MKVGFIGLGKLGMICAEVMATHYDVVGFDTNTKHSDTVNVVGSVREAVEGRDIVFIAVQTPHDDRYDGRLPTSHMVPKDFDYSYVENVLSEVNRVATSNQLVVLISTCLPGTTRSRLVGRIPNAKFIYNPYFIAMGSVAHDMVNPEMIVIGTARGETTDEAATLIDFYKPLMRNNPRIVVGTWDEVECIKVFYNSFISAKIGLVNMMMDVAVKNGNINVDVVSKAIAESTQRIMSPKYMVAGLGDSGGCHPRDNIALRHMSENLGLGYDLFAAIMDSREIQARNLAEFLYHKQVATNLPIFILGKTFKPNVPYIDGSYSILIAYYLDTMSAKYSFVDPNTGDMPDPQQCIAFLAHNAPITYGAGVQPLYIDLPAGSIVVDPWRTFQTSRADLDVIHYGNTRVA